MTERERGYLTHDEAIDRGFLTRPEAISEVRAQCCEALRSLENNDPNADAPSPRHVSDARDRIASAFRLVERVRLHDLHVRAAAGGLGATVEPPAAYSKVRQARTNAKARINAKLDRHLPPPGPPSPNNSPAVTTMSALPSNMPSLSPPASPARA